MNCPDIIKQLGFECSPRPNSGVRVFAPFTFDDGTGMGVYVEPLGSGKALVTDHGDAFMHLSAQGVNVTARRLRWAAQRCYGVVISEGGAIQAIADVENIGEAIASVLDASIRLSHQEREWLPSISAEQFERQVADDLEKIAPQRVMRAPVTVGISGHQLEFPLGVAMPNRGIVYIQPVSTKESQLDWSTVYRTAGKMTDIREAGVPADRRIVVIDDRGDGDEVPRAMTLLSTSATVLQFSQKDSWLRRFAA